VDLQTTSGDLINAQFVHLYRLPTYAIDKKSLNTVIMGSKGVIEKACDFQMDYRGYTETRTLYVAHLAGWDMILSKPALTALNALIPAGPNPVTIQPEGMARFALKEWRKAGLAKEQVTSAALTIEDEASDYLLPLFEFIVSAMSLGESREFNPFIEFAQLFPATTVAHLTSCHPSEPSTTEYARNPTLHGYQNGDPHPPNFMQGSQDSSPKKKAQAGFIVQNMIPMR